jgi:hypothetical protein
MKLLLFTLILTFTAVCDAQPINEGFDNIMTLSASGWVRQNNSNPVGSTNWFQGRPLEFTAHTGASNSYIAADFNNTTGNNTISNWLITPPRIFLTGDRISFYTRTVFPPIFSDRLQVRLSVAGESTNTGGTPTSVGDFTTLLLDINPMYVPTEYPSVWTRYDLTISGLSIPAQGRLAFRYFVENGGPNGDESYYIGIDSFAYTPVVLTAATATLEGRILTSTGRGLNNVSIILTAQNGETRTTRSSSLGYYRFEDLPVGATYTVSAVSKKHGFAPRLITMSESVSGFDITADSAQ